MRRPCSSMRPLLAAIGSTVAGAASVEPGAASAAAGGPSIVPPGSKAPDALVASPPPGRVGCAVVLAVHAPPVALAASVVAAVTFIHVRGSLMMDLSLAPRGAFWCRRRDGSRSLGG